MKVLIVHTSYKYKGGEDTVVAEEMKLLKANGVSVELLEFTNDSNTLLNVLQLPFNMGSWIKTRRKLRLYKADVVHIHNLHFAASPSVLYAIKSRNVPVVYTLHNYRLICPSATFFHEGRLFLDSMKSGFPWRAVSAGVYKNSKLLTLWLALSMRLHNRIGTWQIPKRFIALTPFAKSIFSKSSLNFRDDQLIVKPNFSATPRLQRNSESDYFAFVGRLSEEKGIRLLLETFSSGKHRVKIAGEGPLEDLVTEYSRKFANIEYLGPLDKHRVFELVNNSSALVFPSIWFEGMPLTIIEAFSCGVPVIASKLGAMQDMISDHHNGLHFETGNKEDFLEKLNEWAGFTDNEKDGYRNNAWNTYTANYSPQNNFWELMSIYRSAMGRKPTFDGKVRTKLVNV